jgi:hypothetical protein
MSSIYIMTPRSRPRIDLTPQALIGLLCALAKVERLPARGWAVEVALDWIDGVNSRPDLSVKRSVARWKRGRPGVASRYAGLEQLLIGMARQGLLAPDGRGWSAGFVPAPDWVERHVALAARLPADDLAVLAKAAQGLSASIRTWSKKAVASRPTGSETI